MADNKPTLVKPPAPNGKIPIAFQLGDRLIDGATIKPMSFSTFAGYVSEAQAMKTPAAFDARLRRLRLQKQVTYHINGSTAPVSMEEVLKLPIPATRTILARLDSEESKPGKITRDGDGIEQAIVFELGTPIPVQGKEPIRELEFFAKTYGDIEDVMAAPDTISQAATLIATIAKPLGSSLSLLPSWAAAQISVADGLLIAREILPRFLESPAESSSE
jgi:hypothetical protein